MKIDDVELTLFSWDDIPPTRYTPGSQNVTGRSNLGFLRIATDDGIEGHALLGSAINPAETDAGALIRFVKPVLMGKDRSHTDGRRPPPFPRDSCVSLHTVNLRSAASSAIIRISEHFHVFSPPPRFDQWTREVENVRDALERGTKPLPRP